MRNLTIRLALLAAILGVGYAFPPPALAAHCNPCGQGQRCCGDCTLHCSGGACVGTCDDCCAV